jgi:flagellar hook-basal body complex protein FliE
VRGANGLAISYPFFNRGYFLFFLANCFYVGGEDVRIGENISLARKPETTTGQKRAERSGEFQELLKGYMNEVNALQLKAEELDRQLAAGTLENIHEATIAAEKAALALELTIEIRNKVVEAYQEIMRMPI